MVAKHKKVSLKSIQALTFRQGEKTTARRGQAIPQLQCTGQGGCSEYEPEIVACQNVGDDGTGMAQWKCEADLPDYLRFGKTDVSCEGWSKAGDSNVLQGSCGLTYTLTYRNDNPHLPSGWDHHHHHSVKSTTTANTANVIITIVMYALSLWALWNISTAILKGLTRWWTGAPSTPGGGEGGGGGPGFNNNNHGGGGGGGGGPPPYSKLEPTTTDNAGETGWRPGFWTGLTAGAAALHLFNNRQTQAQGEARPWDWEREREGARGPTRTGVAAPRGSARVGSMMDRDTSSDGMRRATGFGGTSTR